MTLSIDTSEFALSTDNQDPDVWGGGLVTALDSIVSYVNALGGSSPAPVAIPAPSSAPGNPWLLGGTAAYSGAALNLNSSNPSTSGVAVYPTSLTLDGLYLSFDVEIAIDGIYVILADPAVDTPASIQAGAGPQNPNSGHGFTFRTESYYNAISAPDSNNGAIRGGFASLSWQGAATDPLASTNSESFIDPYLSLSATNQQIGPLRFEVFVSATNLPHLYRYQIFKNGRAYGDTVLPGPVSGQVVLGLAGYTGGLYGVNTLLDFTGFTGVSLTDTAVVGGSVDSGWLAPTLENNWTNYTGVGYAPVSYRKDAAGVVHLRGLLDYNGNPGSNEATGQSNPFFNLPAGFRPAYLGRYAATGYTAGQNTSVWANICITATGDVYCDGDTIANICLDGISFLAEE